MKEVKVQLRSIDDVKDFVSAVSQFKTDIDLVEGHYIIDAKSILGIFSLDLTHPVTLQIEDEEEAPAVIERLKEYIVTE